MGQFNSRLRSRVERTLLISTPANEKIARIEDLYEQSDLPEQPDILKAEELLIALRGKFYKE